MTVRISQSKKPSVVVKSSTQSVAVTEGAVAGPAGPGLAPGGDTGNLLVKKTGSDYDTEWVDYKTTRYVHSQQSASAEWVIQHTLGGRPSVTIVDSAGTTVFGEVKYLSDSDVVISFTNAFSGSAYLT
jgi:hypothetical protein